jgi:hypothetical protein
LRIGIPVITVMLKVGPGPYGADLFSL